MSASRQDQINWFIPPYVIPLAFLLIVAVRAIWFSL